MSKPPLFNPDEEDFSIYVERLGLYFEINETPEKLRKSYLCVNLSLSVYSELKTLLAPTELSKASYEQCVKALTTKFSWKSKVIPERFLFHQRKQKVGLGTDMETGEWY
ncbi:uncharacterized protein LOC120351208 [Nilaparvata lugens]|uniref:uncharacterized protein LOC120351208 n=1 Tax=Nilaparvata lugens TaxID=108931 RepID=UPI00193E37A2|nr:uncharacterized protein LOC120351208 [Nilaparvata lugens]